jgi:hypothetical protein
MTHGNACVIFELGGHRYEYDGGLPDEVCDRFAHLFDAQGFWRTGYPDTLAAEARGPRDALPTALWEIRQVGGRVIEVQGTRPSGAILEEDWKQPRIY